MRKKERAGKKEVVRKEESRLDRDIGKGEIWEERKLVGMRERENMKRKGERCTARVKYLSGAPLYGRLLALLKKH